MVSGVKVSGSASLKSQASKIKLSAPSLFLFLNSANAIWWSWHNSKFSIRPKDWFSTKENSKNKIHVEDHNMNFIFYEDKPARLTIRFFVLWYWIWLWSLCVKSDVKTIMRWRHYQFYFAKCCIKNWKLSETVFKVRANVFKFSRKLVSQSNNDTYSSKISKDLIMTRLEKGFSPTSKVWLHCGLKSLWFCGQGPFGLWTHQPK